MDCDGVRALFHTYRPLEGEAIILEKCLSASETVSPRKSRLDELRRILALMNGLLRLLPEEESYIIRLHLIDKLDWPRVCSEHGARWGRDLARTEQTLKRKQATAFKRIIAFMSLHESDFTDLLLCARNGLSA
jgi:hypothetical protein